jgi:hypothetical protein
MMTPAKKKSEPKIHWTDEMKEVVYNHVRTLYTDGQKNSMKDVMELVKDEIKEKFGLEVSAQKLLGNYYNWLQAKHKKSKIVSDPDDIRYILLVYGTSGVKIPTFCCDRDHLRAATQRAADANGGTLPNIKIFAPIQFKVNIEEVSADESK